MNAFEASSTEMENLAHHVDVKYPNDSDLTQLLACLYYKLRNVDIPNQYEKAQTAIEVDKQLIKQLQEDVKFWEEKYNDLRETYRRTSDDLREFRNKLYRLENAIFKLYTGKY